MGPRPMNDPLYATLGNGAHIGTVVSALAFAVMVAKFARNESDTVFDKEWKTNGFCVTNADVPYWNSHDMCLYVDTASAIVLGLIYFALHKTPGLERANELFVPAILGIFAHGVGHGNIGREMRDAEGNYDDQDETGFEQFRRISTSESMVQFLPAVIFWLGLIKAAAANFSLPAVIATSAAAQLGVMCVPRYFGFTYVQTVLLFIFSLNQLARKKEEKDFTYAMYAMLGAPITLVGWMESTQCTAFVKDKVYGHLVYDAYTPVAVVSWYMACYARVSLGSGATQTIKKSKDL